MTPKEKAYELYEKFISTEGRLHIQLKLTGFTEVKRKGKKHSLIAVDEILKAVEGKYEEYWKEVKQEIEKL